MLHCAPATGVCLLSQRRAGKLFGSGQVSLTMFVVDRQRDRRLTTKPV
jgi:hypothetical protein